MELTKDKMFRAAWLISLLFLFGCQSLQEKNIDLIKDRAEKLKPLSTWRPTWCRLEAHLTQPAMARYRQMFPEEDFDEDVLAYTWKARKATCEISALQPSTLTKSHQGFLETAMCILLQVHWINSPFEGLEFAPQDVDNEEKLVHIRPPEIDKKLGVYLDPVAFIIETRTKSRGILKVAYSEHDHDWLPDRLEQDMPGARVVVDGLEYSNARVGGRRMLKSFWISVGDETPFRHTQVMVSECQNY
jgi:hypothetical protein